MSHPCHVELTLVEEEKQVEKEAGPVAKLSKVRAARQRSKVAAA